MTASPVRISASMLRDALSIVTVGWFDRRSLPPPTVEAYGPLIEDMRERLAAAGDLPWFLAGLRHVLDTPGMAANELANTRFAYTEPETRGLMSYILATLGPAPATGAILLEEMPPAAWRALRDKQQAVGA
jgi:hypothetical protein